MWKVFSRKYFIYILNNDVAMDGQFLPELQILSFREQYHAKCCRLLSKLPHELQGRAMDVAYVYCPLSSK